MRYAFRSREWDADRWFRGSVRRRGPPLDRAYHRSAPGIQVGDRRFSDFLSRSFTDSAETERIHDEMCQQIEDVLPEPRTPAPPAPTSPRATSSISSGRTGASSTPPARRRRTPGGVSSTSCSTPTGQSGPTDPRAVDDVGPALRRDGPSPRREVTPRQFAFKEVDIYRSGAKAGASRSSASREPGMDDGPTNLHGRGGGRVAGHGIPCVVPCHPPFRLLEVRFGAFESTQRLYLLNAMGMVVV